MSLWRFRIARWLIHAGLRIMPSGRARSELYQLIDLWSTAVRKAINAKARQD